LPSSPSRVLTILLQPWLLAKLLFKSEPGTTRKERLLDRIAFWRAAVGLATIALITSNYHGFLFPWASVFGKTLQAGAIALYLPPVAFLLLLAITRSGHRRAVVLGARRLLVRAGAALGVICLPFLVFALLPDVHVTSSWGLLVLLALPFLLLWYVTFWVCTVYWAARTGMWTGEMHPLLAPICTTLVMLGLNVAEFAGGDSQGLPYGIWLTLNLCGTVSSLALAWAEFRHLRSIGYRFRTGPEPMTRTAPEPALRGRPEPAQ
jgi:hypothetical protein